MKKKKLFITLLLSVAFVATGCMSEKQIGDKVRAAVKSDPTIITDAIDANPAEFILAFQKAAKNAQGEMAKKRDDEEAKKLEDSFDNPLVAEIRSDEAIRGKKGAPLTLIEYSDFECPFCTRGYNTVRELLKKYDGKIQFVYKHLPLSFHRQALIAAQYYEAIRIQSHEKAFQFHDQLFYQQKQLASSGEKLLKKIAKNVGADMDKLKKDANSKEVLDRIEADQKEAAKFGMQGTPGFLINGIPVKGAYPTSHFEDIISKLKEKGKVKL